jgi:hypothetical protein
MIMPRLINAFLFMLSLSVSAWAQGGFVVNKLEKITDEERALLRKGFKLSDSATIIEIKGKSFLLACR